jgi:RNA polymerase-binding transcription factor DksA
MSTFTADLDNITAGMSVTRYANDDDEFNYAVSQMEDLGHDREAASAALAAWIEETPTWDCPNCDLENIEEAGYAYCPNCDEANPSMAVEGDDTGLANLAETVSPRSK